MVFEYPQVEAAEPVRISLRPASTTVAAGDTYAFDGEGRLLTASRGGAFYKRGLSHRVVEKRRLPAARHAWAYRDLEAREKTALVDAARETVARVRAELQGDAPADLHARLDRILSWDAPAYAADVQRFHDVYRPVGILPPDQYMAVVLQATLGCHYNDCTFCTFYRDTPFHVRDEAAFRAHVGAVRAFLGAGLGLRRTLFLADANALVVSQRRLVSLFRVLHEAFDVAPPGLEGPALAAWRAAHPEGVTGVYSFLDAFTGRVRAPADFAELGALGLRRVYIGMESGHEPLLDFLAKPSRPADVQAVVEAARAGGVHVGVIVMAGAGGDRYAEGHVADTVNVVNRLGLAAGDLVYVSEFVEAPSSPYVQQARAAGIRTLAPGEVAEQAAALRAGFVLAPGVQVAAYHLREFIY